MQKSQPTNITVDEVLAELTTMFPTAQPLALRTALECRHLPVAPIYLHLVGSAYGEPVAHDQLHLRGLDDPNGVVQRYLGEIDRLLRERGDTVTPQAQIMMFLAKMLSVAEAEREPYHRAFGILVQQLIPAVYFIGATLSITEERIDTNDFIILRQTYH